MAYQKYSNKIPPNRQLETARAREIFHTWETLQNKENLMLQVKSSIKWFDEDGVRRIMNYIKEMRDGTLD
tara:strand:+ start:524 stop:733 length:210 start_codon:yes stop_codon:yes gene_type:complete